ncbi:hypothetical protein REPUB_Repub18cG0172000 [Reevesia pubescens]
MEIRTKFLCSLLETVLLLSSFLSFSLSYSSDEVSSQLISRRLLKQTSIAAIQQFLRPHNILIAERGLPPLKWSKTLANYASRCAHKRQGDCALIHSNSNYGENLFWGSGKDCKPSDAVAAWAAEKRNYNSKTNTCTENKDCLHYTQRIWRNSFRSGARELYAEAEIH